MAQPEASMAERYLKDECLGFVTEYLQRFNVVHKWVWNAKEEYGDVEEVLEGAKIPYQMIAEFHDIVH